MQDIEFTIEDGRLWILQSRAAKRTARAALKIAVDLVHEGLISEQEGLERVKELDLEALSIATFAGSASPAVRGIGASGGVAVGLAAFDAATAERMAGNGDPVILIPLGHQHRADVKGIAAVRGDRLGLWGAHGACGVDRAAIGQGLRGGLCRARGERRRESREARWRHDQGRRLDLTRWHDRRGFSPASARS